MRIFFNWSTNLLNYLRSLAIISLLCLILGWSLPAQAATRISPKLEQQVIQIIREHPEVLIESVQAYQQQQQQQIRQSQQAFLQDLQINPQSVIGNSPVTGSPNSKIVLVEFSDFECPYCAEANKTLKKFMEKHQDKVTLVYKHFPLTPIHAQALPAAKAAWAAFQQGKFWEYSDALFSNQKQLDEALYLDIATNLKLDLDKFKSDRSYADNAIVKDMQLAQKLGLTGTPFFVMNGVTFSGAVQLSDMEKVLARATQ
ncbi:DsbA family protein [Tolypothrix sp. VBCCA 56010]|uniref:DsbA family protein n=1 Tax=Tolypothrix sp. VBCCA 56010 TaxID=3137731 RepID=UPI003D7DD4AA